MCRSIAAPGSRHRPSVARIGPLDLSQVNSALPLLLERGGNQSAAEAHKQISFVVYIHLAYDALLQSARTRNN